MTDNLSQESIITPIEDKRLHRFDDVDEDIFNNIDGIESPKPSSHRSNLLDKYKDHKEHYDFIKILIDKYINSFKNMARIDEGKPPLIDFYDVLGFLRKNNIKEDNTNQLKKDIFTTVTKEVPSQSFHILDQVNEEYYDIILSTVFEEAPELYMEESAISALNNVL